jgi:hypothetical protein
VIELDLVAVKGKAQAGRIFTLPPERIEQERFVERHSELLTAYRRRISQFQSKAPPANWNGVFSAEEK